MVTGGKGREGKEPLPGIFKYSNPELFNCQDGVVPYSRLLNTRIYIYIYSRIRENVLFFTLKE